MWCPSLTFPSTHLEAPTPQTTLVLSDVALHPAPIVSDWCGPLGGGQGGTQTVWVAELHWLPPCPLSRLALLVVIARSGKMNGAISATWPTKITISHQLAASQLDSGLYRFSREGRVCLSFLVSRATLTYPGVWIDSLPTFQCHLFTIGVIRRDWE